jgi:Cys-tRNA(Pro)/Cys-tRNA(Cys) deacylase
MNEKPPASRALDSLQIPHQVFRHEGPVQSLEQAAAERGQRPEQVVRSILFRLGEDEYVMALVGGPAQISWKHLRKLMGRSRLTMASEQEVLAVTGYRVGAVSPFGTTRPLRVVLDSELLKETHVSLGSGVRGTAILMSTADLMRALGDPQVERLTDRS